MAEESAKLRIPYIAAAQAQKHVTHNEAMTLLDTLVQLSVIDKDLTAPPGSPAEGDTYIVAAAGTGAWVGWDDRIARFIDGTWRSYLPGEGDGAGWLAYVIDESTLYVFTGTAWEQLFVAEGHSGVSSVNGETGAVTLTLDDVDDVNVPSPDDGHVLTWDDGAGEWISAAPAGSDPVTLEPEGEWDNGTSYVKLDVVSYQGSSYVSRIDDNAGNEPDSSPTEWLLLAEKGEPGVGAVDSVNGETGIVSLDAGDIPFVSSGLGHTDAADVQEALEDHDAALDAKLEGSDATESPRFATTVLGGLAAGGQLSAFSNTGGTTTNTPALQSLDGGAAAGLGNVRFTNSSAAANFFMGKSRGGSHGDYTIVQSGDLLGSFIWNGADGTDFATAGAITCNVDGTPGNNDMPGRIGFHTTPDGSNAATERLRISQNGAIAFPSLSTTASAANAFLDSGSSPANNLLRSTSSLRYKRDVEAVEEYRSDAVLSLRPIWYRSKAKADNPEWSFYGLAAEEVAVVDPRLVHWGYSAEDWEEVLLGEGEEQHKEIRLKDDAELKPESVMYERIGVLLLDVVRRQRQQILVLEARIAALGEGK